MSNFLPADFQIEESNSKGYFNIKKLELNTKNKFRIVGQAITGYSYWKDDNGKSKSVHVKNKPIGTPIDCKADKDGKYTVNQFLAFPIFDYYDSQVKIMELIQKTVMKAIVGYAEDEDWGDVTKYDFNITRSKDGEKVEYLVSPVVPKPLSPEAIETIKKTFVTFNLEELYSGGNPFESKPTEVFAEELPDPSKIIEGVEMQF
jgi:hypothetical protein